MGRFRRVLFPLLLLLAGTTLVFVYLSQVRPGSTSLDGTPATALPPASATVDSLLLPTATPSAPTIPSPTAPAATGTPRPALPLPPPTRTLIDPTALPLDYLERFGITGSTVDAARAQAAGLVFGSYANWNVGADPHPPEDVTFWQMIRLSEEGVVTPQEQIETALAANPGAIWLIGNEPDVKIQDNVTPARYAELYHDLYTYIKEQDPSALVAIGGVSQPTLLRRTYLDRVLDSYQETYGHPLPADIWNVHAFILREEQDSWGVGIPPGLGDGLAMRYEIADHNNLSIFRQNVIEFRAWMAERGYGDRPLVVSEYGFLMPHEYGFPPPAITEFMWSTFDFFLEARNDTGYAADDGRLVQWWFWFYLGDESGEYTSTHLYDRETGNLTPLGEAFSEYVTTHAPPD